MASPDSGPYGLLDRLAEEFAARYRRGERPSPEEYAGRHPELAEEIRELFPALVEIEQVEQGRREAVGPEGARAPTPPRQVGDYRIVREVGRGGMGVVYEAEQVSLGRRVALKVLPRTLAADPRSLERFRREARSAARLHHTNIVPVFEVGRDDEACYYAMQFIHGQGLDEVVAELRRLRADSQAGARPPGAPSGPPDDSAEAATASRVARSLLTGRFDPQSAPEGPSRPEEVDPLEATEVFESAGRDGKGDEGHRDGSASGSAVLPGRAQLSTAESAHAHFVRGVARVGLQAASALAYAHERGVIHRDVKPSNLLLDTAGVAWVTDFGLAKTDEVGLTGPGDILGTLRYMAPERFRGQGDARADIYGLGLTLYELLTLRPAFASSDRPRLIEQVKEQEPPRPRSLDPRIPRDLETIVLKAIDKDPARRYPTADELAADLQRFLEDRPVRARRSGPAERVWRACKRNPLASTLAAGLLLALVVGLAGVTTQWLRAETNAGRARAQQKEALRARDEARHQRDEARRANRELSAALDRNRRDAYVLDLREARRALDERNPARVRELLDRQRPGPGESDLRGFEWHYLQRRGATFDDRRTLRGHRGAVRAVAFDPRGRLLATGGSDGTVRLRDAAAGRETGLFTPESGEVTCLAFNTDGTALAAGSSYGTVTLLAVPSGSPIGTWTAHDIPVVDLAFDPDGRRLATAGRTLKVWDVESRGLRHELSGGAGHVPAVAFSPDGRLVASARDAAGGRAIDVWEADSGRLVRSISSPDSSQVHDVAFHPDGRLAAAHAFVGIIFWDVASGREAGRLFGHSGQVYRLAYGADGRLLASAGDRDEVAIWDTATDRRLRVLEGHVGPGGSLAIGPDGRRLAAAGEGATASLWDLESRPSDATLGEHGGNVIFAAYSPDGRMLASCGRDPVVRLWDVATGELRGALAGHRELVMGVAFSPDGRRLASASSDRTVILWDVADGRAVRTFSGHSGPIMGVAFHPDGRRIASAGGDNASGDRDVRVWDAETGRVLLRLPGHATQVRWVAFSPDGRLIASSGHYDGTVRLWDAETGAAVRVLDTGTRGAGVLAFSPDGGRLAATTQAGGTVKVWDVADGSERLTLRGHAGGVWGVAFSPDGRRLASAGTDRSVRVWDADSGQELLQLGGHAGYTTSVAFRPDGLQLATASHDRTVRLWDADGSRSWGEQAEALAAALDGGRSRADPAYAEAGECIPEVFDRVARLRPRDARLRVERGRALARQGRSAQADAAFARAAEVAGGDLQVFLDAGWWVVGPYPPDLRAACPPESDPDPSQRVNGVPFSPKEGPSVLRWQDFPSGLVSFEDVLPPRTDGADISAYALAYVYTPLGRKATLAIGGVDPMRAWLNGRPIYEYDPARPSPGARDLVPVTLRAGRNVLLVRIASGDGLLKAYVGFVRDPAEGRSPGVPGGRWAPVVADFEAAAANSQEPMYFLGLAALWIESGDRAAYSTALRDLIGRHGETSDFRLTCTAWLCGMAPDADVDRERLVRELRRAERSVPSWSSISGRYQLADPLGVALLRAGRYAEAIERLEATDEARGRGSNATSRLYRALAHHHLGHREDARRLLEDARTWLAEFRRNPLHPSWPLARRPHCVDRMEWRLLLREAESLVGGAAAPEAAPGRP